MDGLMMKMILGHGAGVYSFLSQSEGEESEGQPASKTPVDKVIVITLKTLETLEAVIIVTDPTHALHWIYSHDCW